MSNLVLVVKRLIGKYLGHYCEHCGSVLEGYGYSFRTYCPNKLCAVLLKRREVVSILPVKSKKSKKLKAAKKLKTLKKAKATKSKSKKKGKK